MDVEHGGRRWRAMRGLALLGVVLVMWLLSSYIMNALFKSDKGDETIPISNYYNKPFLVTYLNTASFIFYLIPSGLGRIRLSKPYRKIFAGKRFLTVPQISDEDPLLETATPDAAAAQDKLDLRETAVLALQFCLLWFVANYTSNAALSYTNVPLL